MTDQGKEICAYAGSKRHGHALMPPRGQSPLRGCRPRDAGVISMSDRFQILIDDSCATQGPWFETLMKRLAPRISAQRMAPCEARR